MSGARQTRAAAYNILGMNEEAEADIEHLTPRKPRKEILKTILLGLLILLAGWGSVAGLVLWRLDTRDAIRNVEADWSVVRWIVDESLLDPVPALEEWGRPTRWIRVKFSYAVDGNDYFGEQTYAGGRRTSNYSAGDSVTVYYDPTDHENAVLKRGVTRHPYIADLVWIPLLAGFCAGGYGLYLMVSWW